MCLLQIFQNIARDRLTALAVFCRPVTVSAGAVLATQNTVADRVFLILEGEVHLTLEGESANPMDPHVHMGGEAVAGMAYLAPGSSAAVKAAVQKQSSIGRGPGADAANNRCVAGCPVA